MLHTFLMEENDPQRQDQQRNRKTGDFWSFMSSVHPARVKEKGRQEKGKWK